MKLHNIFSKTEMQLRKLLMVMSGHAIFFDKPGDILNKLHCSKIVRRKIDQL